MAKNKFVCPECGGSLYYWKDEIINRRHNVNPKTGKINKTFTKDFDSDRLDHQGFECEDCGWLCNIEDSFNLPEYLKKLEIPIE